jgi:hypothetical protein
MGAITQPSALSTASSLTPQMYQNLVIIAAIRFPNYSAIIISQLQILSVGAVRQTTLKITNATNVV